jgi:hypothetical protein
MLCFLAVLTKFSLASFLTNKLTNKQFQAAKLDDKVLIKKAHLECPEPPPVPNQVKKEEYLNALNLGIYSYD